MNDALTLVTVFLLLGFEVAISHGFTILRHVRSSFYFSNMIGVASFAQTDSIKIYKFLLL